MVPCFVRRLGSVDAGHQAAYVLRPNHRSELLIVEEGAVPVANFRASDGQSKGHIPGTLASCVSARSSAAKFPRPSKHPAKVSFPLTFFVRAD